MKNNIKQKIVDRFSEITISENPSGDIFERIKNDINKSENVKSNKKTNKIVIKPILVVIMFAFVITTVAAATPLILKMLGSDISFFNSDKQTRYSADKELIKQYSSEVGVTAEGDGFSFTVDNIAFDGTFMNVFYTIKSSEVNLYEEVTEKIKKWGDSSPSYVQTALVSNQVNLEVVGYTLLHDPYIYVTSDGYFASDYELKAVQRYTITDDLPDVFDINIIYHQYQGRPELWSKVLNDDGKYDMPVPIIIALTVDMSESKVERLVVKPNSAATIIQPKSVRYQDEYETDDEFRNRLMAGDIDESELDGVDIDNIDFTLKELPDTVEHKIIIDRVSISPLGNVLVITEKGSDNPVNRELFDRYFITDNKGNFYRRYENIGFSRNDWAKDETSIIEFFGNVPSDAQSLKLIPYILHGSIISDNYPEAELGNLPQTLKQSEHGSIIIESYTVTENEFTFTYKYEGLVSERIHFMLTVIDGEEPLLDKRGYTSTSSIYDKQTDSYACVYTFPNPPENLKNIIKGIEIIPMDIELLEEQTIIIPLK